jgi:hypothetical protein
MTMKDRATIFITEPQDPNLDYEIARGFGGRCADWWRMLNSNVQFLLLYL